MTFDELHLLPQILQALKAKGYTVPTPIQEKSIPHILAGKDIFGSAQTGTGKTAAFAVPILQNLFLSKASERKGIKTLVLAPTRELAQQISDSFREYGRGLNLKHTVIYGGVGQRTQTDALRSGVDIVIACPGRLLDLMNQGFVRLGSVEFFVLDEVDRMLDMGFINDIKKIIQQLPAKKQTLFFSATMPPEIKKLSDALLHQPVFVQMNPTSSAAVNVTQKIYFVDKGNKKALLSLFLKETPDYHLLVFTRTKRGADKLVKSLSADGVKAEAIHGNKSQGARDRALGAFKKRKVNMLVATDVASRGLDITDISHVINFDLPEEAETYVHRIGRTGRAGATGIAISYCSPDERDQFKDIQKLVKNNIEIISNHPFAGGRSHNEPRHEQRQAHRNGQSHSPKYQSGQRIQSAQARVLGDESKNGQRNDQGQSQGQGQGEGRPNQNSGSGHNPNRRYGNRRRKPRSW